MALDLDTVPNHTPPLEISLPDLPRVGLLLPGQYLEALLTDLQIHSGGGFSATLFAFRDGMMASRLASGLMELLESGGRVDLALDAVFSRDFMEASLTRGAQDETALQREAVLRNATAGHVARLREAGGDVVYVNEPGHIARKVVSYGRDHRKDVVVHDREGRPAVAYIGSVNFEDAHYPYHGPVGLYRGKNDFMVRIEDPVAAAVVDYFVSKRGAIRPDGNFGVSVPGIGDFGYDAGVGTSILGKWITGLLGQMKSGDQFDFVIQLPVDPLMAKKLASASDHGADVSVVMPGRAHNQMSGMMYRVVDELTRRMMHSHGVKVHYLQDEHGEPGFTHAKAAYVELGGRQYAYAGSQNLHLAGYLMRTIDTGVLFNHPGVVQDISAFIEALKVRSAEYS